MKYCNKCKETKQNSEFNKKLDGLSYYCKGCQREYIRNHYKKNKQYYSDKARTRQKQINQMIDDIKSTTPCKDCGITFPGYVMDFDHLEGHAKIETISRLRCSGNISKIKQEIEKCDVVCSNCHRHRTHTRTLSSTG